jgi:hypothetical protein
MAQTSTQISGNLIPQGKKIEPKKVKLHWPGNPGEVESML